MFACACVCVCVHVLHTYACVFIRTYVCVCTLYVHMCVSMYMYVSVHPCMYVCVHVYVCEYVRGGRKWLSSEVSIYSTQQYHMFFFKWSQQLLATVILSHFTYTMKTRWSRGLTWTVHATPDSHHSRAMTNKIMYDQWNSSYFCWMIGTTIILKQCLRGNWDCNK